MKKHLGITGKLAALLLLDTIFFGYIDPVSAYALVVVAGFVLLMVNIYAVTGLLLAFLAKLFALSESLSKRLRVASTSLIGLLVAMQSIGQLTVKDMFAIVPLVILLIGYLSYQRKERQG